MKKPKKNKSETIAEIRELFLNAREEFDKNPARSDDLVKKARRIAKKLRLSISPEFKKSFCRHCCTFWVHGNTVRVRLQKQKVVYYCLKCRHYARHPYSKEKKLKRKS